MITLKDNFNRVHDYLRISLTDKCNLNCIYCNPAGSGSIKLDKRSVLSYDEILRLIDIFAGRLGIKKIRFTGGEPLVRKDILYFFEEVYKKKLKYGFETGLTTNGTLLEDKLESLKNSGLDKLNISLDSLKQYNFRFITGSDGLSKVLRALDKAAETGFSSLKLNAVIIKNINDDEIINFTELARDRDITVRFIEFMPFGNNAWKYDGFISYAEMKDIVQSIYHLHDITTDSNGVSKDYYIEGFKGRIGFISSISEHFCGSCSRLRIDARGHMKLCLFSSGSNDLDLKSMLNSGLPEDEICASIQDRLKLKAEYHPAVEELIRLEENKMLSIGG